MKERASWRALVCVASLFFINSASSAAPLNVVSSFSILADMVEQVGGEHVRSSMIIGPESDAHAFEPRPSDARTLANADLVVINGAQFEAWLPRLVQAADYKGPIIEATEGVPLRSYGEEEHVTHEEHEHEHEHGSYDPHAWQSLDFAQRYVVNIKDALVKADPEHQGVYEQNAADYTQRIQQLKQQFLIEFQAIPPEHRTVVTPHDAMAYLGQDYQIEFLPLLGASNQAEPSAKELASLIEYMRDNQVKAVFMEQNANLNLTKQLARETGAVIGKTLYSDALAKAPHPADTYLGMMQWNIGALLEALKS